MIAILSDIHGNLPALSAVLEVTDALGCDVISLGDVAGYYCWVNECIEALRARRIVHLLGNHDRYLAHGEECPRSVSANRCLAYQRDVITKENLAWLRTCEPSLSRGDMSLVHGGWNDFVDEYLYEVSEEYFASRPGRLFFSGHTHVQTLARFTQSDKLYCNPGSVGQPRDGDWRAAFATVEGDQIRLRRVGYDIAVVAGAMEQAGFEPYFYENLYTGSRIGGGLSHVRVAGKAAQALG